MLGARWRGQTAMRTNAALLSCRVWLLGLSRKGATARFLPDPYELWTTQAGANHQETLPAACWQFWSFGEPRR